MHTDEKGFLLTRSIHKDCLRDRVDISSHLDWLKDNKKKWNKEVYHDNLIKNKNWDELEKISEEHAIYKLYLYRAHVDGDEVYKYDNIRPLSGSSGYVLIRNGLVETIYAEYRS